MDEMLWQAESCFIAAMMKGWAAGVKGIDVPGMPAYKEIVFEGYAGFRVVDRWCVSRSGKSTGATTIWFANDPIWIMNYGGFYSENALSFLKQALMRAYNRSEFVGGRGPQVFQDENDERFVYVNKAQYGSKFRQFEGREFINKEPDGILGWHDYWGMALI